LYIFGLVQDAIVLKYALPDDEGIIRNPCCYDWIEEEEITRTDINNN